MRGKAGLLYLLVLVLVLVLVLMKTVSPPDCVPKILEKRRDFEFD